MIVSAIAAIDRSGLIGNHMEMPWHLPQDLRRFREHTLGKPVILGRRTLESLRAPLEKRVNIVLSHDPSFAAQGACVVQSIADALKIAHQYTCKDGRKEVVIIGGGVVFDETVHLWDRLLLTVVDGCFRGDTYFPVLKASQARWRSISGEYHRSNSKNPFPHWFLELERRKVGCTYFEDFDLVEWLKNPSVPVAALPLGPG